MVKFETFVINLKRRSDRLDKFMRRIKELDIDFINSITVIEAHDRRDDPKLGCLLSHIDALRKAKTASTEHVMICEDDVFFVEGCNKMMDDTFRELPSDFKLFFCGVNGNIGQFKQYSRNLVVKDQPSAWTTGTHCYIIPRNEIDNMISLIEKNKHGDVDVVMTQAYEKYFIAVPFIAFTLPNDQSDIRYNIDTTNDHEKYCLPANRQLMALMK